MESWCRVKCDCIDCKLSEHPCEGDCSEIICLGCEEAHMERTIQEKIYEDKSGLTSMVGKRISEIQ